MKVVQEASLFRGKDSHVFLAFEIFHLLRTFWMGSFQGSIFLTQPECPKNLSPRGGVYLSKTASNCREAALLLCTPSLPGKLVGLQLTVTSHGTSKSLDASQAMLGGSHSPTWPSDWVSWPSFSLHIGFCLHFWQNDWCDLALNLIPSFLQNCMFSLFPLYWIFWFKKMRTTLLGTRPEWWPLPWVMLTSLLVLLSCSLHTCGGGGTFLFSQVCPLMFHSGPAVIPQG